MDFILHILLPHRSIKAVTRILLQSYFNHSDYYQNKCDMPACIGLIVKIEIPFINIFNTIVYSTFYEFYIIRLKMTMLGQNILPE